MSPIENTIKAIKNWNDSKPATQSVTQLTIDLFCSTLLEEINFHPEAAEFTAKFNNLTKSNRIILDAMQRYSQAALCAIGNGSKQYHIEEYGMTYTQTIEFYESHVYENDSIVLDPNTGTSIKLRELQTAAKYVIAARNMASFLGFGLNDQDLEYIMGLVNND